MVWVQPRADAANAHSRAWAERHVIAIRVHDEVVDVCDAADRRKRDAKRDPTAHNPYGYRRGTERRRADDRDGK